MGSSCKIGRLVVLVACVGTILASGSGCMTVGRKLDTDAVNRIQNGKTTRQQVLAAIGSPDQVTRDGNGNVTYMYMYMRTEATPESFIPYIGCFVGGTKTQNQTVIVTFGPNEIVTSIQSTMGGMETSENLAAGKKATISETEDDKRPK